MNKFGLGGFRALIKWLGTTPVARVVYEPAGPYHRSYETALSCRFPLAKVNTLHTRRFTEASGTCATPRPVNVVMNLSMPDANSFLYPQDQIAADAGPVYSTSVVTTVSGIERRNANSYARGMWKVVELQHILNVLMICTRKSELPAFKAFLVELNRQSRSSHQDNLIWNPISGADIERDVSESGYEQDRFHAQGD